MSTCRAMAMYCWVLGTLLLLVSAACGDNLDPGLDADPDDVALLRACADSFETIYTKPTDLPAFDASRRGEVVRCGKVDVASASELSAQAAALGYTGGELDSGATIYRIAYRTERVPGPGGATRESLSSGLLLVPSAPRGGGVTVVYSHPTVGLGDECAPSRRDLLGPRDGWYQTIEPLLVLAGHGYTVIAPDYAGMNYGEQPGFAIADDVSRSVLDATRAAAALVPAAYRGTQVAFVGHSLGGHASLAAYASAASYGMAGELIGVSGLAPLWLSPYAFAALTSPLAGYDTTTAAYPIQYAMDYLWTHAELLDGPGAGDALFVEAKRAQTVDLLRTGCVTPVAQALPSLGATPAEFFEPAFYEDVGLCGITGQCTSERAALWAARFRADRPAIPANGPPVTLWFGEPDGTITPGFARCAMDRLGGDVAGGTTQVRACMDPSSGHVDVPVANIGWVSTWIAELALGEPPPPACPPLAASVTCTTPPPNL
jgi:pimeloyl-ACP methyl ester carboxylesterase